MLNKKYLICLLLILLLVFVLLYVLHRSHSPLIINGVVMPRCNSLIQYSGTSYSIGDITIPTGDHPITFRKLLIQPKTIQQASDILKILNMEWMRQCLLIPTIASSTGSKKKILKIIMRMEKAQLISRQMFNILVLKNGAAFNGFTKLYFKQVTAGNLRKLKVFPFKKLTHSGMDEEN